MGVCVGCESMSYEENGRVGNDIVLPRTNETWIMSNESMKSGDMNGLTTTDSSADSGNLLRKSEAIIDEYYSRLMKSQAMDSSGSDKVQDIGYDDFCNELGSANVGNEMKSTPVQPMANTRSPILTRTRGQATLYPNVQPWTLERKRTKVIRFDSGS